MDKSKEIRDTLLGESPKTLIRHCLPKPVFHSNKSWTDLAIKMCQQRFIIPFFQRNQIPYYQRSTKDG